MALVILIFFAQSAASGDFAEVVPDRISRIAFGSCAKESRPQPIWERVLATEPELFIWAGDNIYADTLDPAEFVAKYNQLKAIPGYAKLASQVPVLATWDDHDFGTNDAGAEYPLKREAQGFLLDFLGVPSDSPRRQREGVYHAVTYGPEGKRVQIIVLDTRYHRSPLERFPAEPGQRRGAYRPVSDRSATMLGEAQWQWLEQQLKKPAEVRLIVTSIQFVAEQHRFEKWGNLSRERRRMLRMIRDVGARGVIFLSGDRHHAELSALEPFWGYPLYDLTASGINQSRAREGWRSRAPEPNAHRLGAIYRGHHFGTVEIDWDQPIPAITLSIVNDQGETPITHTLHLDELQNIQPHPRDNTPDTGLVYTRRLPLILEYDDNTAASSVTVIDGEVDEWDDGSIASIYGPYLNLRFPMPDERSIRRHPDETVQVALDLDADVETGASSDDYRGAELVIHIGQRPERVEGGRRWGPAMYGFSATGETVAVEPDQIDLHFQPTRAGSWVELRVDRAKLQEVFGRVFDTDAALMVDLRQRTSGSLTPLVRHRFATPGVGDKAVDPQDPRIPEKAEGAVRVMALNVLWETPQEDPAPFVRLFNAIDPDIYLIQEWDRRRYTESELIAWFKEHVDAEASWDAMASGSGSWGSGTAIVSAHPFAAKLPPFTPVEAGGWDFPARIAAAGIDTPAGRVLASSVHFKAGGSLDSPEDVRRMAEAKAANRLMHGMAAVLKPDLMVFGGDYNLNGSFDIVKTAVRGLDRDGSGLKLDATPVLGRPGLVYTHGRGHPKNRLDFIAYPESAAKVTASYVLDTTVLPESTLRAHGLEHGDSHASDHLPVVVDLKPWVAPIQRDRP